MSKPTQQRHQRKNKSAKTRAKARTERCAPPETWPVNPAAIFEAASQIFSRGPEPKPPTTFSFSIPIGG